MKERINRLARGMLDMDVPQITGLPEKIIETVSAGKRETREFFVSSANNLHIKGLVYTNHTRVMVENVSFGGLRNRISYLVDASFLEDGDVISGAFELVTNGGEITLPFIFTARLGASGQTLAGLKTVRDFAVMARKQPETALRLFNYQDFTETLFMQDIHIRTIYDGLKGHGDRENQLEEFLVALGEKRPTAISIKKEHRKYTYTKETICDELELKKNFWGYVSLTAKADTSFLELPKKQFNSADFQDGICRIPYRILGERLHQGKNLGSILIHTPRESFLVSFEVDTENTGDNGRESRHRFKKSLGQFMALRLEAACGLKTMGSLRRRMIKELDVMKSEPWDQDLASLWMAEILLSGGKKEQAALELEMRREEIFMGRRDHLEYYCFFQYITQKLQKNLTKKESLLRLVRKCLMDREHPFLFFLRMELDDEAMETPLTLFNEMKRLYDDGLHSPFLYLQALKLLQQHIGLLQKMDSFMMQVLYFGARKGIIGEEMALAVAWVAKEERQYLRLLHRTLVLLYKQYPQKDILEAVCGLMIKGDCRKASDFAWYERALEAEITLTRLYEYYLYSLPQDYHHLLPKEVLLYFSYGRDLDRRSKAVLYKNMLLYLEPSSRIYQEYEKDMEQFAMEQLFCGQVDNPTAVLYSRMIYRDMIDDRVARVLPSILRTCRISCTNAQINSVVVRYEEFLEEEIYPIVDGEAYVPLFSDRAVLLFQDAFGNRYMNIAYTKTPIMDQPELEERCFAIYPGHPMLCMAACRAIAAAEEMNEAGVEILERSLTELPLNFLYRKILLSRVIRYYQKQAEDLDRVLAEGKRPGGTENPCTYLLTLDIAALNRQERLSVCSTLICQDYLEEAYLRLKTYGWEGMEWKRLEKLCSKTILANLFDQDYFLLNLSYQVFAQNRADRVILDYLCEHYNGNSIQMYKLLTQSISAQVETYDLEERLLCQMMFSGKTNHLDKTFNFYKNRKKMSDPVKAAYFTTKSIGYFLMHQTANEEVFSFLESVMGRSENMEKFPIIYLLALTRYYSECRMLDDNQKKLCQRMNEHLIEKGLVFPYTKKLSRFIPVPQEIMDKAMVAYEGNREDRLSLMVRILPDERDFRREEMRRVYQGMFICQKVLFEGETMEYQIYRRKANETMEKVKEGSIHCELAPGSLKESRFASLNEMGLCLSMKEEAGLKKSMKDYLIKNAALEELFPVIE